jgi:hypothetical protein
MAFGEELLTAIGSVATSCVRLFKVTQLVEPLRCEPEGRAFDSDGKFVIFL